jgi:sugar (pentulose or hexulose) kinase
LADRAIIVIDIGKTLAKLTLWDRTGHLIERRTRSNARIAEGKRAVLDVAGVEAWLADTLRDYAQLANIGSIIPVAHGAAAAIVHSGKLTCAPTDYEAPVSRIVRTAYDAVRAPFDETGSPALPDGLNLGVQLYQLCRQTPDLMGPGATILLWPQYWSWLLSGVAASECTSLGCHSDLWNPAKAEPSELVKRLGWTDRLPPLRKAGDALAPITAEWAARTRLPVDTQIHCGIHDSNAALIAAQAFPEIAHAESTVISTGTWFVAMRSPGEPVDLAALPEARDCLVNVDAFGRPVPSARWMGGREIENCIGIDTRRVDIVPDQPALLAAVPEIVAHGAMLLPSFALGVGPFPATKGMWINPPDDWTARRAAVCLYAALMTNVSLDLIGAKRSILVEGRFADAEVFVRALASLRPDDAVYTANAHNDVSFGALRLIAPDLAPPTTLTRVRPLDIDLAAYRARWMQDTKRGSKP